MGQLVLSLAGRTCTLTSGDLEAFPDSLFARIAKHEHDPYLDEALLGPEGESEPELKLLIMKLDSMQDGPFVSWPVSLDIIASLYRNKTLPVTLLGQLLSHGSAAAGNSSTATPPEVLYRKLLNLINYLGIPGPVTSLLDIHTMGLSSVISLEFLYTCMAYEAAHLMVTCNPHTVMTGDFQWLDMATFLVTTSPDKPALDVRMVEVTHLYTYRGWVTADEREVFRKSNFAWGTNIRVYKSPSTINWAKSRIGRPCIFPRTTKSRLLPAASHQIVPLDAKFPHMHTLVSTSVGPEHLASHDYPAYISKQFAQAVQAMAGPELSIAVCEVAVMGTLNTVYSTVPVWVVQWRSDASGLGLASRCALKLRGAIMSLKEDDDAAFLVAIAIATLILSLFVLAIFFLS